MYPKNKWKHILPLLLVLFLVLSPVATAQDILIPETQPTKAPDDFTDHQTVEVTGGFISYPLKGATATLFYPLEKQVLCQDDGVLFQKYTVEEGDTVKSGQVIGIVGHIPAESLMPAHLHFECLKNNKFIDPMSVIK